MPPILDDEELERRERLASLTDPVDRLRVLDPSRHSDLALTESIDSARPRIASVIPDAGAAPDVGRLHPASSDLLSPSRLRPLGFQDRQRLPTISAGTPGGSSEFYRNQVERIEDQKAHPWGSEEN